MAAKPWCVDLPTSRGNAQVYPSGVTGVTADNHHTTPVIISHGKYGQAQVYLSWEEARALIERMPPPWNCTAYSSQCYRRRGTETPNPHCLSCLLGKLCETRRQGDFRVKLERPEHPLKIPALYALGALAFVGMWASADRARLKDESAATAAPVRRHVDTTRAERDRRANQPTFRRQARAKGKKR